MRQRFSYERQTGVMMDECRARQDFSKDLRSVFVGGDPDWYECFCLDVASNEMIVQVYVFCSNMVHGLLG
jgi:hypothetical protein